MANVPRTARTHEEIKAANEAYLKTKGVTNTPSAQQAQVTGARAAAYNPGRSVYMRQGTIDARRSGRPIGTPGYPPAAWQVGPDVVDRGLYNKPAVGQEQSYAPANRVDSYVAYDSQKANAGISPAQRESNAVWGQAIHEAEATRGLPNAALTMIPGHGYIVDPRRQAPGSPYGLSPMRANQVPAQVTSPAPVAINQAPVAPGPVGPRLPSLPGQMPSTFGGDRRLALATGALPQAPVAPGPVALGALGSRDRRPAPYPAEWLPETLEDQVSNTLRAVPGTLMAGARNVGKGWSAWRSNVRKKKAAYAQRKKK
jgi:hypothetical protein